MSTFYHLATCFNFQALLNLKPTHVSYSELTTIILKEDGWTFLKNSRKNENFLNETDCKFCIVCESLRQSPRNLSTRVQTSLSQWALTLASSRTWKCRWNFYIGYPHPLKFLFSIAEPDSAELICSKGSFQFQNALAPDSRRSLVRARQ